jgi:hypothetical protein
MQRTVDSAPNYKKRRRAILRSVECDDERWGIICTLIAGVVDRGAWPMRCGRVRTPLTV